MCNSWNHSQYCQCGFGGEGHLGIRGNASSSHTPISSLTLNPTSSFKNGKQQISYLNPNARCPVCGDNVFFYQSPHGGRVFFDELDYPWLKHPCTDNSLCNTATQKVEFLNAQRDQHIFNLIYEMNDSGYFPLICIQDNKFPQTKISGKFLFKIPQIENLIEEVKKTYNLKPDQMAMIDFYSLFPLVLSIKTPLQVSCGVLFFIKEIDSAKGLYTLKFFPQLPFSNENMNLDIEAQISTSLRPILKDQNVVFHDFSKSTGQKPKANDKSKRLSPSKKREAARRAIRLSKEKKKWRR